MPELRPLRLAALALALALAGSAQAFELDSRAETVLARGRAYVEVAPDADGSSGHIQGAIDIAAPMATVWATINDCALAPRMAPNLKSCRVVETDPAGAWEVREQVSKPTLFLPSVTSVFRSDYERPGRIRFRRVSGDLTVYEGEWRLGPRPGGKVRVTYEARVAAPFRVPGPLARMALRREVPRALMALRREAEARAR